MRRDRIDSNSYYPDQPVGNLHVERESLPPMPVELKAAIEWAYHRLMTGMDRPSVKIEAEIKLALRDALRRSKRRRFSPSRR
ncbi:MAG TPA: hypothetical protein VD863_04690 [Bradyrhizobium sp.]|nr:hypothetical protein [Bradyrhizobium sp.]